MNSLVLGKEKFLGYRASNTNSQSVNIPNFEDLKSNKLIENTRANPHTNNYIYNTFDKQNIYNKNEVDSKINDSKKYIFSSNFYQKMKPDDFNNDQGINKNYKENENWNIIYKEGIYDQNGLHDSCKNNLTKNDANKYDPISTNLDRRSTIKNKYTASIYSPKNLIISPKFKEESEILRSTYEKNKRMQYIFESNNLNLLKNEYNNDNEDVNEEKPKDTRNLLKFMNFKKVNYHHQQEFEKENETNENSKIDNYSIDDIENYLNNETDQLGKIIKYSKHLDKSNADKYLFGKKTFNHLEYIPDKSENESRLFNVGYLASMHNYKTYKCFANIKDYSYLLGEKKQSVYKYQQIILKK